MDDRSEVNIDSLCGWCWAAVPAQEEKKEVKSDADTSDQA